MIYIAGVEEIVDLYVQAQVSSAQGDGYPGTGMEQMIGI